MRRLVVSVQPHGESSARAAWLGFVATIMLGQKYYENRSNELFSINAGYQLVGIVAMGAIIGVM